MAVDPPQPHCSFYITSMHGVCKWRRGREDFDSGEATLQRGWEFLHRYTLLSTYLEAVEKPAPNESDSGNKANSKLEFKHLRSEDNEE